MTLNSAITTAWADALASQYNNIRKDILEKAWDYEDTTWSWGAYLLSTDAQITSYSTWQKFVFQANHTNAWTNTLNVNSNWAKSLKDNNWNDLRITSWLIYEFTYNWTNLIASAIFGAPSIYWDWSDWDLVILNWETVNLVLNREYNYNSIDIQAWWTLTTTWEWWIVKIKCLGTCTIDWEIDLTWTAWGNNSLFLPDSNYIIWYWDGWDGWDGWFWDSWGTPWAWWTWTLWYGGWGWGWEPEAPVNDNSWLPWQDWWWDATSFSNWGLGWLWDNSDAWSAWGTSYSWDWSDNSSLQGGAWGWAWGARWGWLVLFASTITWSWDILLTWWVWGDWWDQTWWWIPNAPAWGWGWGWGWGWAAIIINGTDTYSWTINVNWWAWWTWWANSVAWTWVSWTAWTIWSIFRETI